MSGANEDGVISVDASIAIRSLPGHLELLDVIIKEQVGDPLYAIATALTELVEAIDRLETPAAIVGVPSQAERIARLEGIVFKKGKQP